MPPIIAAVGAFILTLVIGDKPASKERKGSRAVHPAEESGSQNMKENEPESIKANTDINEAVQDEADLNVVEAEKFATQFSSHVSVPPSDEQVRID